MIATKIKRCIKCRRDVASVDEGGWCRGCVIAGHLTDVEKRVLAAVRKLQPCLMHDVADEVGFASTSSAIYHLRKLRHLELVHWEDGKTGTLIEIVRWQEGESERV